MLTDSNLRSAVDALSAKPWSGGVSNPFATIEQLRHYVTEIAKRQSYPPFGFMTKGLGTWFWEARQDDRWLDDTGLWKTQSCNIARDSAANDH